MTYNLSITKNNPTYDLHVMWAIHNKCNYSCSYCPDDLHNGTFSYLNLDYMKGFIDKIYSHYTLNLGFKNILFSFTGGEPTLWSDYPKFLDHLNHYGFRVGLTSNGSVSPNYWKRIGSYFDYICLSFHPESADIDKFLAVYETLHNDPTVVIPSVRVMMHKEKKYWDKSVELIKRLKKFENWTYECVHILEDYGIESSKINYGSDEMISFLKENSFNYQFTNESVMRLPEIDFNYNITDSNNEISQLDENSLINKDQANFKDWRCYIGIEQLFINVFGDIYKAGCLVGGKIGSVFRHEALVFPTEPEICTKEKCHCPTDIRISKFHPKANDTISIQHSDFMPGKIDQPPNYKFKFQVYAYIDSLDNIDKLANFINLIKDKVEVLKANPEQILIYLFFDQENSLHNERLEHLTSNLPNCTFALKLLNHTYPSFEFIEKYSSNISYYSIQPGSLDINLLNQNVNNLLHNKIPRGVINFNYNTSNEFNFFLMTLFSLLSNNKLLTEIHISNFPNSIFNKFKQNKQLKDKIQYINGSLVYYNAHPVIFDITRYRRSLFIADNIVFDSHNNSMMQSQLDTDKFKSFKNWACKMSSNLLYINETGSIQTSKCSQSIALGTLQDYRFNEETQMTTICQQAECIHKFDRNIPKEEKTNV